MAGVVLEVSFSLEAISHSEPKVCCGLQMSRVAEKVRVLAKKTWESVKARV